MSEAEFVDGLASGRSLGRASGLNPADRFQDLRLHVLGDYLDEIVAEHPDGTRVVTQVFRDTSRSILSRNDSPDIPFTWSVNPYRGCEHGCIYCYARPYHEFLSLSCGMDFETKIVAKYNAPGLLREALLDPKWKGEGLVFSGVTDAYQPIEAKLRITRACMEVCAEMAQPVSIITKNKLVTRDLDCLKDLARYEAAHAAISITTLDNRLAAHMEPRASSPRDRLAAVKALADAGVPVQVMVAPIIPALNESEAPAILRAAADAGAYAAGYTLVRLPHQVKALFTDWLRRTHPLKAAHVEAAIRDTRDGELSNAEFGTRMRGEGERAKQIGRMIGLFKKRYGLDKPWRGVSSEEFLRRRDQQLSRGQMALFG